MFLMFSIADAVSDKSVVSVRGSVGYSRFYYANCKGIRLEDISKPWLRMRILYPRICNALPAVRSRDRSQSEIKRDRKLPGVTFWMAPPSGQKLTGQKARVSNPARDFA